MAFILQDDTGLVANANAYISVAFFRDYHADRGVDTSDFEDTNIQAAIIKASDYVDLRFQYRGNPLNAAQSTQFPRIYLCDAYGNKILGLPLRFKQAVAEYALRAATSALTPDPVYEANGKQISSFTKKVGPIEKSVTYAADSYVLLREYPTADVLLEGYIKSGSFGSFTVYRG